MNDLPLGLFWMLIVFIPTAFFFRWLYFMLFRIAFDFIEILKGRIFDHLA